MQVRLTNFQYSGTANMSLLLLCVCDIGITKDMLVMMMKPNDFTDVINLNLNGVFYASQAAFMGSMMGQKRGRIINVASIVGG